MPQNPIVSKPLNLEALGLDDMTHYDAENNMVTHRKSGLVIIWPKTPKGAEGQLSTVFRLAYQQKDVKFRMQWDAKEIHGTKTLLGRPYRDDAIESAPSEDLLQILIRPLYACLGRYVDYLKTDPKSEFALTYGTDIYTPRGKRTIMKSQA